MADLWVLCFVPGARIALQHEEQGAMEEFAPMDVVTITSEIDSVAILS